MANTIPVHHHQKYLVPLARMPDAAHVLVPSRVFPWVGFGFCAVYLVLIACWFGAAAASVKPAMARGSTVVLWFVAAVLVLMLAWAIVHACRIGAARHRLVRSLDGTVPPPRDFTAGTVRSDVEFYFRDDRLAIIRFLTSAQAWTGLILDVVSSFVTLTSPADNDMSMFHAAKRPRTAFVASTVWLSLWFAVAAFIGLLGSGANGDLAQWPLSAWVALAAGVLVLSALWTISGIRLSLDRQIRRRAVRLDASVVTGRYPGDSYDRSAGVGSNWTRVTTVWGTGSAPPQTHPAAGPSQQNRPDNRRFPR